MTTYKRGYERLAQPDLLPHYRVVPVGWRIKPAQVAIRAITEPNEVDLQSSQMVLGHESFKITELYTHITDMGHRKALNPLDDMDIRI